MTDKQCQAATDEQIATLKERGCAISAKTFAQLRARIEADRAENERLRGLCEEAIVLLGQQRAWLADLWNCGISPKEYKSTESSNRTLEKITDWLDRASKGVPE